MDFIGRGNRVEVLKDSFEVLTPSTKGRLWVFQSQGSLMTLKLSRALAGRQNTGTV